MVRRSGARVSCLSCLGVFSVLSSFLSRVAVFRGLCWASPFWPVVSGWSVAWSVPALRPAAAFVPRSPWSAWLVLRPLSGASFARRRGAFCPVGRRLFGCRVFVSVVG